MRTCKVVTIGRGLVKCNTLKLWALLLVSDCETDFAQTSCLSKLHKNVKYLPLNVQLIISGVWPPVLGNSCNYWWILSSWWPSTSWKKHAGYTSSWYGRTDWIVTGFLVYFCDCDVTRWLAVVMTDFGNLGSSSHTSFWFMLITIYWEEACIL